MSYGLRIWDASGNMTLDTDNVAYAHVDIISVSAGASGSQAYSNLNGWTVYVAQVQDFATYAQRSDVLDWSGVDVTITYPSGVPTVAYNSNQQEGSGGTVRLFVFGN